MVVVAPRISARTVCPEDGLAPTPKKYFLRIPRCPPGRPHFVEPLLLHIPTSLRGFSPPRCQTFRESFSFLRASPVVGTIGLVGFPADVKSQARDDLAAELLRALRVKAGGRQRGRQT